MVTVTQKMKNFQIILEKANLLPVELFFLLPVRFSGGPILHFRARVAHSSEDHCMAGDESSEPG